MHNVRIMVRNVRINNSGFDGHSIPTISTKLSIKVEETLKILVGILAGTSE